MSTTLKPAAPTAATAVPVAPPADSTWRRYSAHKEGELSWLTSFALHGLVIGVLIALGILYESVRQQPPDNDKDSWKNLFRPNRRPLAKPVVLDAPSSNPLGKGNPDGPGGDAARGNEVRPEARAPGDAGAKPLVDQPLTQLNPIDAARTAQQIPDWVKSTPAGRRFIQTGEADERMLVFRNLNDKVVSDLNKGLQEPVGDPNKGGTPDGVPDGDPNKGGDPSGGGRAGSNPSEREKRMYRWKLDFDLRNVSEAQRVDTYLHQLDGLGAILALPLDRNNSRFLVVRNLLQKPVHPTAEDPSRLRMIYWYETNPAMAQSLGRHLGVPVPNGYIILLPQSLEVTMEKLEREKAPGVRPDDIEETRFKVVHSGSGYTVECLSVRKK